MSQSTRSPDDSDPARDQPSQLPQLFLELLQQPQMTQIINILQLQQQSQGESGFGDNPRPFFSICSKAAEEEDNEMVERWQKDAKGILIFTGLFSAAVSVLLSLTIPDLKPDTGGTSAFYLGKIYEVLADPNVTRASFPSLAAEPDQFSPPRHAVWVNVLWFLSLVMSVSCALLATSLQQWARRYIHLTQPARCNPEKRARMRGFFKNGVDKMYIWLAVEGLPTLLHFSLFLFFGGLGIFLFHVDKEVFTWVIWWIGLFSMVYLLITLLPLFRQDSPYYTPLSTPFWYLRAIIQCATFAFLAVIANYGTIQTWVRFGGLRDRYFNRMLRGMEKRAEETASERSSEIDVHILGWTIEALGDDNSLEKFFEAIPGFFNSEPERGLERNFPERHLETFWSALDGFMGRTSSSHSITESVKSHRDTICRDIMSMIPCSESIPTDNLRPHHDNAPETIERFQSMARWTYHRSHDVSNPVRLRFAKVFVGRQELDVRWIGLAYEVYGLPDPYEIALSRDNAILTILIHVCRQVKHSDELRLVEALTQFHIRDTLPGLQHNFCSLWNDLVQEARPFNISVNVLRLIRHLYNDLHPGADAPPTAIHSPADPHDRNLLHPWSYTSCIIATHRSGSTAHPSTPPSLSSIIPSPGSPPTNNATLPRPLARGLVNPDDNKCFMNVVLQLLVHSPPFWSLFSRELGDPNGQPGAGGRESNDTVTPLVDATVRFCGEFMLGSPPQQDARGKPGEDEGAKKEHNAADPVEPKYMYDAMKKKEELKNFLDHGNEDAQEFLSFYLDALHSELVIPASSDESLLSHIFGRRSRPIGVPSQPDDTFDNWGVLPLNIQHDCTIQEALKPHLQPEPQFDQPSSIGASQKMFLKAIPPILVLYLVRVGYDRVVGKITEHVRLAPELEISLAPVSEKSAETAHYKLHGVLYHHSQFTKRGHYTVHVLDQNGGGDWLHINDEVVTTVKEPDKDVFGDHDKDWKENQCVYMLFYCRTST